MSDFTDDLDWCDESDFATAEFEDVAVIAATDKAILCVIDGKQHWIPQSQVHPNSEVWRQGDKGTLVISWWLAVEKGLV